MAKKKAKDINKSELIREYKEAHPDAKPKEIADALTKQTGITFTNGQVSTVLHTAKKKAPDIVPLRKKPAKKKAAPKRVSEPLPEDSLGYQMAINLVATVGFDRAEAILNQLKKLKHV